MCWDEIAGSWTQFTGRIKEKWGHLTDDDLTAVAGKREQLLGKLQKHYGYGREEAERELDEFTRSVRG